ncbi:MAG TPA: hypothetical protein V6D33_05375 [Cyanophyceae cyanobacterium]
MTTTLQELSDWVEQYRSELEKECSARAAQVESLLIAGDYEAICEWLREWEQEDKVPGSLRFRYRSARSELRQERFRQRQQQRYGTMLDKITGKASTKSLTRSGADLHSLSRPSKQSTGVTSIMPDTSPQRPLNEKEQLVVDTFSAARPGLGELAQANIQNPNSGWREIVADMDESEIVVREGHNSNNGFIYRHIGH